jgi:hypothetical protein
MTTQLTDLFNQLSEAAPDVCQPNVPFNGYTIGEYGFWYNPAQGLIAQVSGHSCTGKPALAWLQAALQAAIEARGWGYTYDVKSHCDVTVFNRVGDSFENPSNTDDPATALLTAFVAACEASK